MEFAHLGRTQIQVSRICLGTAFRSEGDESSCLRVIARALDTGCNFVDCANAYRDGLSERFVGKAVRGRRDQVIVATKVGAAMSADPSSGGLSRSAILRAAESSLTRLQTDYIDLYICHFPDPEVGLEETLQAMDDLVRQGKIRHAGCSNFPSSLLRESLDISKRADLTQFVCNQILYNLLSRQAEDDILPLAETSNISITAFAPTSIGLLSGHFRYGEPPLAGSPWDLGPYNYRAAMTRQTDAVIEALIQVGRDRDKTPIQVALAWCLSHPPLTSVIIGADTTEQVDEDFGAVGWQLSTDEKARLDSVASSMRMIVQKDAAEGYQHDLPWS